MAVLCAPIILALGRLLGDDASAQPPSVVEQATTKSFGRITSRATITSVRPRATTDVAERSASQPVAGGTPQQSVSIRAVHAVESPAASPEPRIIALPAPEAEPNAPVGIAVQAIEVAPQTVLPQLTPAPQYAPPPVAAPYIEQDVLKPQSATPQPAAMQSAAMQVEVPRIGAFTQFGTITPADVRALALQNNKDIAVLGRAPAVTAPLIDVEASVFDPVFNVALNGGRYNRQTSSQIQSLGSGIPILKTSFWQPTNGLNQIYLEKQFVTGGKVQTGLGQTYFNYSPAGDLVIVNPAYQASFNVSLDQPLFRGRGPVATTAPIRIARANHDQSWHVFRATVQQVLRDAEYAYWDAYAAFQDFEVRDMAYRQSLETLERERERLRLGEGSVPDVAQAEEQAEAFHIARADAENRLVAAQRTLRRLAGLPPDDPRPIVPAVPPLEAPLEIDWSHAAATVRQRPEFAAQQAAVQAVEIELARRRNGLLPDLSVQAIYSATGLDDNFDAAWSTAGKFSFNSWTTGIVYKQPLGRRSDRALADRAAAALALETARLQQVEHEILHQLDAAQQHVQAAQRMLELHRRRREAAAVQLTARRELYLENRASLRDQLDAEVRYAAALYDESLAKVSYQRALTEWNFTRGAMAEGDVMLAP